MSDCNVFDIILLDGNHICIPVQPKLLTRELRDIVASHANLSEKHYFGLAFNDENIWYYLQLDRKVLDHDIPKKSGQYRLYFLVEFYLESIHQLYDCNTYEQFYLQAKQSLTKGDLECDAQTFFRLMGLVMQIIYSDFIDIPSARSNLKKLDAIPTRIFELHPSIEYCEKQIFHHYKDFDHLDKGDAILEFLDILERIPSYGIHFYEVKDKSDVPWWIGLSYRGISQYDYRDKTIPRKSYIWSQINEFSNSRQRFTMEILDSKKASMTRRGLPSTSVHWYTSGVQKAKMISSLASDHLNFFSSMIQNSVLAHKNQEKKRDDVAYELTHRRHSFSRLSNLRSSKLKARTQSLNRHRRGSEVSSLHEERDHQLDTCLEESMTHSHTTNVLLDDSTGCEVDGESKDSSVPLSREVAHQLKQDLLQQKAKLIKILKEKETKMRQLMNQEFELTGVMPEGYNEILGVPCSTKPLKKTSFVLSPHLVKKTSQAAGCSHSGSVHSQQSYDEQLNQLEIEYAVVKNIYEANRQKAKETKKKAYKIAYKGNAAKLKKLEEEMKVLRCGGCSLASSRSKLDAHSLNFEDDRSSASHISFKVPFRAPVISLSDTSSVQSSSAVSSCSGIVHSYSQGSLPDLARAQKPAYHASSQISLPGGAHFSQSARWQLSSSSRKNNANLPHSGQGPTKKSPQPGSSSVVTSTQSTPPHRALPGSGDSGFISLHHTDSSSICGSSTLTREDSSSSSTRKPAPDIDAEEDEATIHRHPHLYAYNPRRGSSQAKRFVEAATSQRLSHSDTQLHHYRYEPRDLVPADTTTPRPDLPESGKPIFTNNVNKISDRGRKSATKHTDRTPNSQIRSSSLMRNPKLRDANPLVEESRSVLPRETAV